MQSLALNSSIALFSLLVAVSCLFFDSTAGAVAATFLSLPFLSESIRIARDGK